MKYIIPITIDERGSVKKDIQILANEGENLSKSFSILLPNSIIDKWLYIEFEKLDGTKFVSARLEANGNYLNYDITNQLTVVGKLICQVVAKNGDNVVWKSNKFDFTITSSINATEELVEASPDVIAGLQQQIDDIDAEFDTSNYYTKDETDALLDEKQPTLIAGENITIVDNVISATNSGTTEETDPTVPEYVKQITEEDIAKWNAGDTNYAKVDGSNLSDTNVENFVDKLANDNSNNERNNAVGFAESERQKSKNLLDTTLLNDTNNFDKTLELYGFWVLPVKVPSGVPITVSTANANQVTDEVEAIYFCINDKIDANSISALWLNHSTNTNLCAKTKTLTAEQNNGIVYLYFSSNSSTITKLLNEREYIQVEIGSAETEYQEYYGKIVHSNDKEIVFAERERQKSKNLFDGTWIIGKGLIGIGELDDNPSENTTEFIEVKPNTEYTVSGCYYKYRGEYAENKDFIMINSVNSSVTSSRTKYIRFVIGNGTDYNQTMLEEGSVATEYQEYHGKIVHSKDNSIPVVSVSGSNITIEPNKHYVISGVSNSLTITLSEPITTELKHYSFEFSSIDRVPKITINSVDLPYKYEFGKYIKYVCEIVNNHLVILGEYDSYPFSFVYGLYSSSDYTISYNLKDDRTFTEVISGVTKSGTYKVEQSGSTYLGTLTYEDSSIKIFTYSNNTITIDGNVYTKL